MFQILKLVDIYVEFNRRQTTSDKSAPGHASQRFAGPRTTL